MIGFSAVPQCITITVAILISQYSAIGAVTAPAKPLTFTVDQYTIMRNGLASAQRVAIASIAGIARPPIAETIKRKMSFIGLIMCDRMILS